MKPAPYDPAEQGDILATFTETLRRPIADGGRKRELGTKPSWKVDPGHTDAMMRHLRRWIMDGERVDPESGAHPLVHVAARALMLAYQEERQ